MYKSNGRKPGNARLVFTTLDGIDLPFIPFSWDEYQLSLEGLKSEYRERGEQIDCPQYTVKYANGTEANFNHDATTILQAPTDVSGDEAQAIIADQQRQWAEYKDALSRFEAQSNTELSERIVGECLAGINLPEDNAWETRQRKLRVKIPDDPEEKRRHYIFTVLLKSKSDQMDIITTITAVSMGVVQEADLEKIKASFRDNLWGHGLQGLPGRHAVEQTQDPQNGQVERQSKVILSETEKGVGSDA